MMNSRIQELAMIAWLEGGYDVQHGKKTTMENFAELIIKECADVMEGEDSYYGKWMARVVKKHFGLPVVENGVE